MPGLIHRKLLSNDRNNRVGPISIIEFSVFSNVFSLATLYYDIKYICIYILVALLLFSSC